MEKQKRFLPLLFAAVLLLAACGQAPAKTSFSGAAADVTAVTAARLSMEKNTTELVGAGAGKTFSLSEMPSYADEPYVAVNGNIPYFSDSELTEESFEIYSSLDRLGRCGVAYASVGPDLMPTQSRESISQVKPSGWQTASYDDVDGGYLYNRCHLIGYQLTGENANEKNLITGTRYLNVEGMLPFENMTADYIHETGNHVLYRVTPVFEGNNLVASGVLMEGKSVEDDGDGVLFCVFVYNVQPSITIDYATGESSRLDESTGATSTGTASTSAKSTDKGEESETTETRTEEAATTTSGSGTTYVLNINSKKFHYPSCSSVSQMNESNKKTVTGSREDIISQGYDPCKRCKP
ncbi:MAG: DNA/RNA non-specific endonuclease [Clostridiales bacterium]|nr:DNA/RNA non-specific endonuclease [Clostridiales bacterium]